MKGLRYIVSGFLLFTLLSVTAGAQSFEFNFTVFDDNDEQELTIGMDVDASDGFDSNFDTFAPPSPPGGVFEAKILAAGEEYYTYFRPYTREEVSFQITYQGADEPFGIDWADANLPDTGALWLRYETGGNQVEVDLRSSENHTFESSMAGSGDFELIIHLDAVLDSPQPISPENNSENESQRPTFEWSNVEGADYYELHANVVNPSAMVIEEFVTGTSFTPSENLEAGRTFHWRVRAIRDGVEGEWSDIWEFSTQKLNEPPTIAILNGPADGSTIDFNDPGFVWEGEDSDGTVEGYEVELQGPDPEGFSTEYTFHQFDDLSNGNYTFRVRAIDDDGEYSSWASRSFTVDVLAEPDPDLTVSAELPSFGEIEVNSYSSPQQYTVEGSNLTGSVNVDAPDGFQISTSSSGSYSGSLTLNPDNGNINQNIYVRFNPSAAQIYSGNITHHTEGVSSQNTSVNGTGIEVPLSAPKQVVPANNAKSVSRTPVFEWEAVDDADYYILHSNVIDPAELIVNEEVSGTSYIPDEPLEAGRTFHWRVRAVRDGLEGDWSDIWEFSTQGDPGLSVPTEVSSFGSVQVNTSSTPANYTLSGSNLTSNVTVEAPDGFQVSTSSSGGFQNSLSINPDNGDVEQSIYVRFRPLSAGTYSGIITHSSDGAVTQNTSVSGTGVEIPGIPVLLSPADSETDVNRQPVFSWEESDHAESYRVQLSENSGFSDLVVDVENLQATEYTYAGTLEFETTYYWRVRAENAIGYSDWSSGRSFTTEDEPPVPPPTINITSGPEDESTEYVSTVQFEWQGDSESSTISNYEVKLQGPVDKDLTTNDTSHEFTGLGIGSYTFRVRAIDNDGQKSLWATRNFSVLLPPVAPELLNPADNITDANLRPVFEWSGVGEADEYILVVSKSDTFSELALEITEIKETEYEITELLEPDTEYYWQVKGANESGLGDWSEAWSFITTSEMIEVTLLSPSNNAEDVNRDTDLTWESAANADTYHFQLAKDAQFNQLIMESRSTTDTFVTAFSLKDSTEYFWRVRGSNENHTGEWSETWRFTTEGPIVSTEIHTGIPQQPILAQNYPNPFNPTTVISFGLSEPVHTTIRVFNMLGHQVALLVNNHKSAGYHEVIFDASNLSSGVYLYRLEAGNFVQTQKMMLIK